MKMRKMKGKLNNKGFSLVELIIVIAILAILTAIIAPNMIKYYKRARKVRDIQGAQVVGETIERVISINPDAAQEWTNAYSSSAPHSKLKFNVTDYSGASYQLGNVFEFTMTKNGDILGEYRNNFDGGQVRDATYIKETGAGLPILTAELQEELSTNVYSIAYQEEDLRSFRAAKNLKTGEVEVWVCYVDPHSDGRGNGHATVQYKLWPDLDPRYMSGEEAPIYRSTSYNPSKYPDNVK